MIWLAIAAAYSTDIFKAKQPDTRHGQCANFNILASRMDPTSRPNYILVELWLNQETGHFMVRGQWNCYWSPFAEAL